MPRVTLSHRSDVKQQTGTVGGQDTFIEHPPGLLVSLLANCVIFLKTAAAAAAKSLQSCLTLCDPIDGSPLGSSVPGILQARILEWGAIAFSKWFSLLSSF